jgi:hypothetical protein
LNISSTITVLLAFSLLSAASINVVYAQQGIPNTVLQPRNSPTNTRQTPAPHSLPSSSLLHTPSPTTSKLHAVRIESPTKGQQVPVGKDLPVAGVAAGNGASNCRVSIIVNNIKPYQQVTGTGPGGAADYSKWNFIVSSKYTTIKPGPDNKITARYA